MSVNASARLRSRSGIRRLQNQTHNVSLSTKNLRVIDQNSINRREKEMMSRPDTSGFTSARKRVQKKRRIQA